MFNSTAPDDRSTIARIRDSAIERFGEHGFEKTTVRKIAIGAGVSPGLVLHHFGSKDGLRSACDDYVIAEYARVKTDTAEAANTNPFAAIAAIQQDSPIPRYLLQSMREGSPAATRLFDGLVEQSVRLMEQSVELGQIRPSENLYDVTVVLAAWQFGGLLLREHVGRLFGVEPFSPEMTRRHTRAVLEVLTHGVFTDSRYEDAWNQLGDAESTHDPEEG